MTLDLDALEKVAQEATPGEWKWDEPSKENWPSGEENLWAYDADGGKQSVVTSWGYDADGIIADDEDRAHIATFNPDMVLALISRQREAEKLLDLRLRREDHFKAQRDALQAKLDRVRADHRVDQYTEGRAVKRCICEERWPCPTIQAIGGTGE